MRIDCGCIKTRNGNPAGLVSNLPVGMQIIGRRYADADVLAASAAFERLRPWREAYGICANRSL
jgi:amidase